MPSDYSQIREDNIREYGEGTRHLAIYGQLYAERTHFIFELLQNAEDAGATRILFQLASGELQVKHNGRPFNEQDVRGICGVGETPKEKDLTQIGRFGIGFKSVYAYTSSPEVHSGNEHFKIKNYVRPYPAAVWKIEDDWTTGFIFSFDADDVDAETAYDEISSRFRNLNIRTILFLRNLKEIAYKCEDGNEGVYLRDERECCSGRQVTVMGPTDNLTNGSVQVNDIEDWLIFDRPIREPETGGELRVEIGFKLISEAEGRSKRITKISYSPLFAFFPTEKPTDLGFLIQGPYRTTPARDNIPSDDGWNRDLISKTASLLTGSLPSLKEMGLLTVSLLEAMPIQRDDFSEWSMSGSMFFPVFDAVRKAFKEQELLPAADGTFAVPQQAKLARGSDLRGLFGQDQLHCLFEASGTVKWLNEDITENRTPTLWRYLRDEIGVEVVTPESVVGKLSCQFLSKQTDTWMIEMYRYFGTHYYLYRRKGSLRIQPIIRLQNGLHVPPQLRADDGEERPLVYLNRHEPHFQTSLPIVKSELSDDEESYQFLRKLDIPELDYVTNIIEEITDKYAAYGALPRTSGAKTRDAKKIKFKENVNDIENIHEFYKEANWTQKEQLKTKLGELSFIWSKSQNDRLSTYRKPGQLYVKSKELRSYFDGNDSIAFLSTRYPNSMTALFKKLGVQETVKIREKNSDQDGNIIIKQQRGKHVRGLDGFDPDVEVDGLEQALEFPSIEKSEFVWNKIACKLCHHIHGIVELSTRQTYENSEKQEQISPFGQVLLESEWLPGSDGDFHRPRELALNNLPENFVRDEELSRKLNMRESFGGAIDELVVTSELSECEAEILKRLCEKLREDPEGVELWLQESEAKKSKPDFPVGSSPNPKRRAEKFSEDVYNADFKEYEVRNRSVRSTRGSIEPNFWLRKQYTNDKGQMICQVCQDEMPFKKRDGEYYFEAVEALDREFFPKELDAQYLALCPVCAAMYKEYIKTDQDKMECLKNTLMAQDNNEIPLTLGKWQTRILFVERHIRAMKTILDGQGRDSA